MAKTVARRRSEIMVRWVLLMLAGVAVGVLVYLRLTLHPSPQYIEDAVRAFIVEHATQPDSIEWEEWGPHLMREEIEAARRENRSGWAIQNWQHDVEGVVRVVYRARDAQGQFQHHDEFYALQNGQIVGPEPNLSGADWKRRTGFPQNK